MGILLPIMLVAIGAYVYQTYFAGRQYETKDERYNAERNKRQVELDSLLDKIAQNGMKSLSDDEHKRLNELSGRNQ